MRDDDVTNLGKKTGELVHYSYDVERPIELYSDTSISRSLSTTVRRSNSK
jgi:hypothetical protein